jgi:hypothetical protein
MTGDKPPVCAACGRGIEPCAPCCRHSGWVHRHNGLHECEPSADTGRPLAAGRTMAAWATGGGIRGREVQPAYEDRSEDG